VRLGLVVLILLGCAGGIGIFFWKQEIKYQLPTPIPVSYVPVQIGSTIPLPRSFQSGSSYFLHFYNPDCPCSRFNARHLKSLIRNYKDSVRIVVVVSSEVNKQKAQKELGEDLTMWIDEKEELAKSCGVYSTPQAAIVNKDGHLFYRGNYNRSRYCTTRASNFAELSLIALLNNQPPPAFGLLSTQSYGCELSTNADFELF
jgi:hypothetical protein